MKIVIDARMWNETGIGRYVRNLVLGLEKIDNQNEYFILLLEKDFESLNFTSNFKKIKADFGWYNLLEQFKLFQILLKISPDVYHSPNINFCYFYTGKTIVTVHDLIMLKKIQNESLKRVIKRVLLKILLKFSLIRVSNILTVSNYVKEQISKTFSIDLNKISVIYNCLNLNNNKLNNKSLNGEYLLYVGNTYGYKNILFLINSIKIFNRKLIIVGKEDKSIINLKKIVIENDLQDKVIFEGFVNDERLSELYSNAFAYVFPTLDEGFGLPGLEAMGNGCPVVCSDIAVLREIYKDGALYFEVNDKEDLISKLDMLKDNSFRESIVEKGEKIAKQYDCKSFVESVLKEYKKAPSDN